MSARSVDQDRWRDALLADLAHEARETTGGRLTSIFFGGGTPSLMPPATVAALIEAAESHWGFAPDIEITLEANPSSVEAARFADLAAAGVNRVSLGLQSLDDDALGFLGRAHGVAEGLAALETAQAAFGRVSFDLIYALPGQGADAWQAELTRALSFGTAHLSLYQLTIEPGTRFAAMAARGRARPRRSGPWRDPVRADPGDDRGGRPPRLRNLQPCPARRGEPPQSRLLALPELRRGRPRRARAAERACHPAPQEAGKLALGARPQRPRHRRGDREIGARDARIEALLMGLRLAEGVPYRPDDLELPAVERLSDQGLLSREGERLRVTEPGMLLLDAILAEIVRVS